MSMRIKWHPNPPPPPSPMIIRRRRSRRKNISMHQRYASLFHPQENNGRERVKEVEREEHGGGSEEEKWRVQAEMLRAECNLLRMERELAFKKLEKNRVKMETTLKSAVQTLVSGKEKIFEGKNANAVLEEEIEDLEEKLEELQKSSRNKKALKCNNFDKKAWILQQKLGELQDQTTLSNSKSTHSGERKKSKAKEEGVLEEEHYNYSIITANNSSVASSASTSKRIEFSHMQQYQAEEMGAENKCSGRCKAIVRKIVEQVRAETEQWSQMQEMLVHVRGEMEELQASRDYWKNRAHHSDYYHVQNLRHAVEEWKEKALEHENKAERLELQVSLLKEEMQKCKVQVVKEDKDHLSAPLSLGKQLANEKRMLLRRLKENEDGSRRKPFKDIGNSSSLPRQNVMHTPASATCSFRKY